VIHGLIYSELRSDNKKRRKLNMANKELMNTFFLGLLLPLVIISCNAIPNKASSINYIPVDNNKSTDSSLLGVDGQSIPSTMTFPTNPRNMIASAIDQIRNSTGSGGHNNTNSSIVRDSATVLLGMKVIPSRDFIPLYDSTPYKIMNGHLTAKLPCDLNSKSQLQILIGHIPNLKAVQLELVKELSKPGDVCVYHIDLPPKSLNLSSPLPSSSGLQASNATITVMPGITDLAIQNPTGNPIRLPYTTAVVIGINEIMPINHQLSNEYLKKSNFGNSTNSNNFDTDSNLSTPQNSNIDNNNSSSISVTNEPSNTTSLTK
jgi:hypothetical protein